MNFSAFGKKFTQPSSITQLMDDLNQGLRTPGSIMLGGGNPASIPHMETYFRQLCAELLQQGRLTEALCNYDGPQGKSQFIQSLAGLLKKQFNWDISPANIAITNGSQSAFFYLFNLFAGKQPDGSKKKVLFPLAPEYIGYADSGLSDNQFISYKPTIERLPDGQFKYHIDFDNLAITDDIGLICVSRPTNPTGNVLTDQEISRLNALAIEHQVPLIIDSAYGVPFPGIIFSEATPVWNSNTILCMSLSKLGLPGARCGIVIANENVIQALTNINGIVNLTPCGIGPALAEEMIKRDDLMQLSKQVIKPFYQKRLNETIAILRKHIPQERCLIHKPEGAIFLWLWFQNLPITCEELYQRLKKRGVLMVPGHYFFPGLANKWSHTQQCMRMNYVPEPDVIERGIIILADELEKAFRDHERV